MTSKLVFMHKFFILLIISAILSGCDPKEASVGFREPQPLGGKDASAFSRKYQGYYRNTNDSSILMISDSTMVRLYSLPVVFTKNDGDTFIKNNFTDKKEIEAALNKEGVTDIRFGKDSIYGVYTYSDTLFHISERNIPRYFKGSYFLNYTQERNKWWVQRMDLTRNRLTIGMIMPDDSLFKTIPLKEITEVRDDSGRVVNYTINPGQKELRRLVKEGVFRDREIWIKER